jgi:hypothetical protein
MEIAVRHDEPLLGFQPRSAGDAAGLSRQLDAARVALTVFMKPPTERTDFDEEAASTRNVLHDALLLGKREYLLGHPELLETPSVRFRLAQQPNSPPSKSGTGSPC